MNDHVETAKTEATKHITKAGLGLSSVAIGGVILVYFVFSNWDVISNAADKLKKVDANSDSVKILNVFMRQEFPAFKSQVQSDISAIGRSSEGLVAGLKIQTENRLSSIENWRQAAEGADFRADEKITENTRWRIQQEKRATIRIEQQNFREKRLTDLEKMVEDHFAEHVDQLKRSNDTMSRQIKELEIKIEKLEKAQL